MKDKIDPKDMNDPVPSSYRAEGRRFMKFGGVGAIGFLVDAGMLSLLVYATQLGPYLARIPSFLVAVTVTWALNRRYAFAGLSGHLPGKEYRLYLSIQVAGALINYGVYSSVMLLAPALEVIPVIPLAAGSGVAMLFNYGMCRRYVFSATKRM